MRNVRDISLKEGSNEEVLPGFSADFPYIASRAELDKYADPAVPWHWHDTVELFYMESGCLEYTTPNGKWTFPAGSGGMVNSNVLHTTRTMQKEDSNIQLLHLFAPSFLSGEAGSRMESKYVLPLTASAGIELIPLYPHDSVQADILKDIYNAFEYCNEEWGYEFALRSRLTEIWLKLFELARPMLGKDRDCDRDDKIKAMINYIWEHYDEEIDIDCLARAAHVSRRTCFRLFREKLHMRPVEYVRSFRLRKACRMLTESDESITRIAYNCGLGPCSYFGKVFKEAIGCTPTQYRKMAQK